MSKNQNWAVALFITAAFFAGYCTREFSKTGFPGAMKNGSRATFVRDNAPNRYLPVAIASPTNPNLQWKQLTTPVLFAKKNSIIVFETQDGSPLDLSKIAIMNIKTAIQVGNQIFTIQTDLQNKDLADYVKIHYKKGVKTHRFSVIIPPIKEMPKLSIAGSGVKPQKIVDLKGVVHTITYLQNAQTSNAMGTGTGTVSVTTTSIGGEQTSTGEIVVEIIEYDPCAAAQPAPVPAPAQGL